MHPSAMGYRPGMETIVALIVSVVNLGVLIYTLVVLTQIKNAAERTATEANNVRRQLQDQLIPRLLS